ncbi:phage major capsid protein [Mycobacterium sp. C3-094]
MTLEQTRAAAQELLDSTTGDLEGADAERFQALTQRAEQVRAQNQQRATAARDMVQRLASGALHTEAGTSDTGDAQSRERPPAVAMRDDATRALDRAVQADRLPARGAEVITELMGTGTAAVQSWTQRWAAAAGSEAYERAFAHLLANPTHGHLRWTPDEAEAYRTVAALQAEQRAMGLTDNVGGYMVPLTLDPAIQLSSGGSINPLRLLARVVQTTTDTWQGVTSAGVTAEWTAEAAEMADASPTLAGPSIPVFKGDAFVPFSFEVEGDAVNFLSELSKLLVDGAEQLCATAYTTGNGTTQPKGLITALVAAAGSVPLISPATPETLVAGDVYAVQNALPPRFQPGAQWASNLSIINTLRQFETTNGALKFPSLQDNPPMLLGRPMNEISNLDGTLNPAATENNYPIVYGDFARGMTIVDRIGSTLELVPHLFGANRRPTGQRGAILWFRTGSDVVIPNAFRLLSVPTTA